MESIIYFQTTNDCTGNCRHCFQNSGPGKEHTTISQENFSKVIDHLPKNIVELELTGGEIFKDRPTLYGYLKRIKDINEIRENKIIVEVQTNGFWAENNFIVENELEKLSRFGVTALHITSKDPYHFEQGIKKEYLERIESINKKFGFLDDVCIFESGDIFPKGRGKNVINAKTFYYSQDLECKGSLNNNYVTINFDGAVYMCCFNLFRLPGNIIEDSLEIIIEKAKEVPTLKALNAQGIKGLAKLIEIPNTIINRRIQKYGECGYCAKLNRLI